MRLFLCFHLLIAGAVSVLGGPIDQTRWIDAVQDSTGLVWGVTDTGDMLFTNSGLGWEMVGFYWAGGSAPGVPKAITRTPDGAVVILWNNERPGGEGARHTLTQHCGRVSLVLGEFQVKLESPSIFADSKGNFWITHQGHEIYRFKPGSPIEKVYTIESSQLRTGRDAEYVSELWLTAMMPIEDESGAIWFWSDGRSWDVLSLASLLVYKDGKFSCPVAEGLPSMSECFYAVRKDGSHVLAAFRKNGIYRIDLHTLKASLVLKSDPEHFRAIKDIICNDGRTYVWAWGRQSGAALWFLSGSDGATRLTDLSDYGTDAPIPVLRLGDGVVFGSNLSGLIFVRGPELAVQTYDSRQRFPLSKATRLFAIGPKGILAVSDQGSALAPFPPWAPPAKNSTVEIADISELPIKDKRGRLWARSRVNGESIKEWDGKNWMAHPLPPHKEIVGPLLLDNHGRVWVNCYERVFIFDPSNQQWQIEKGMHNALEHALAADRNFSLSENGAWHGTFSGDGRVSFRDDTGVTLEYFDRKKWRRWTSGPISFALPHFNKKGQLRAENQDSRWCFEGDDWVQEPPKPKPPPTAILPGAPGTVSINGRTWPFASLRHDETGSSWLTVEHKLYRALPGLAVPVFGEDEPNPFLDGRSVRGFVLDSRGNVFLDTDAGECVFLKPKAPLPRTTLAFSQDADAIHVRMNASGSGKHWFEWRLDHHEWSTPTDTAQFDLAYLPNGKHSFEARAIDERLQVDSAGAKASFIIAVDRGKQVADALKQLRSPDYSQRERAVRILVKQPALALPALKKMQPKAMDDQRWWIDAAMQEIERTRASPAPVPH